MYILITTFIFHYFELYYLFVYIIEEEKVGRIEEPKSIKRVFNPLFQSFLQWSASERHLTAIPPHVPLSILKTILGLAYLSKIV